MSTYLSIKSSVARIAHPYSALACSNHRHQSPVYSCTESPRVHRERVSARYVPTQSRRVLSLHFTTVIMRGIGGRAICPSPVRPRLPSSHAVFYLGSIHRTSASSWSTSTSLDCNTLYSGLNNPRPTMTTINTHRTTSHTCLLSVLASLHSHLLLLQRFFDLRFRRINSASQIRTLPGAPAAPLVAGIFAPTSILRLVSRLIVGRSALSDGFGLERITGHGALQAGSSASGPSFLYCPSPNLPFGLNTNIFLVIKILLLIRLQSR